MYMLLSGKKGKFYWLQPPSSLPPRDKLLSAILHPTEVVVIHCKGYQKGTVEIIEGNWLADFVAKEAIRTPWGPQVTEVSLIWDNYL
jgi:hypothetical protein